MMIFPHYFSEYKSSMFFVLALLSALAYGTDVIFGKVALNEMPMIIFIFLLAFIYSIIAIIIFIIYNKKIISYVKSGTNTKSILFASFAIIVGTIIADFLMWKSIQMSKTFQLPLTVTIIHLAPVFSLIFVIIFYKESVNHKALFGMLLVIIGAVIMIYNSNTKLLI